MDAATRDPGRRAASCSRCRASSGPTGERRGDHRAERPVRAVPEEGHRLAVAGRARSRSSTITLEEALAIYAQPKQRGRAAPPRRRCASSARTRSPGSRRGQGRPVRARTSPTARPTRPCARTTSVETITPERAAELLAEKRAEARSSAAKKTARKAPAKKATGEEGGGEDRETTAKKTTATPATKAPRPEHEGTGGRDRRERIGRTEGRRTQGVTSPPGPRRWPSVRRGESGRRPFSALGGEFALSGWRPDRVRAHR